VVSQAAARHWRVSNSDLRVFVTRVSALRSRSGPTRCCKGWTASTGFKAGGRVQCSEALNRKRVLG
jgi:hypothetical protein